MKTPLVIGLLVMALFLVTLSPGTRAAPAKKKADYVGVLVGKAFLRGVEEKDLSSLTPLCAKEVSFDGLVAKGRKAIRRRLSLLLKKVPAETRFKKVIGLSYDEMNQRFGAPPKRLSKLPLKGCVFVLGRLHRGGLVVILKKLEGRFRVIGLTD